MLKLERRAKWYILLQFLEIRLQFRIGKSIETVSTSLDSEMGVKSGRDGIVTSRQEGVATCLLTSGSWQLTITGVSYLFVGKEEKNEEHKLCFQLNAALTVWYYLKSILTSASKVVQVTINVSLLL